MSANAQDCNFGEYDKPGAERSRRRRGEDDDLESDLEEDLLEEDWLSGKKNPSEASDEELNDDLLQSDDEENNASGQDVSLNASYSLGTSYDQQDKSQEVLYTDENVGTEGFGVGDGFQDEEYMESYGQDDEMAEEHVDYSGEGVDYQDEVLDIQINEPIDGEFQDDEEQTLYDEQAVNAQHEEAPEEEFGGAEEGPDETQQESVEATASDSLVYETEMVESEVVGGDATKEESDEEDEEDEESGRLRFKSERKDGVVVRLSDSNKRRSIPETLELSEKAKQDLREFEEQERQKRQNRHGSRGSWGGRGGRGRGFHPYGMTDFRGGHRGKINDHRPPLMGHLGKLPSSQMPLTHHLHHQQMQQQHHHHHQQQQPPLQQHHHSLRSRGPAPFQEHGRPIVQQPLQPLIPPHMMHRSPPMRPQIEPPRMMNSPPHNYPPHHHQQQQQQQQAPQPKNIHINPHFRGSASSSVQVPLMPPAQSQPRPAVSPQRFPGVGDFQQHLPGNFGQPQRPPHHMEPFRNQPPQGPQERETLFMGERTESTRFPGLHMFDHQGPSPLMSNNHNLHHQQQQLQLPGQGHMGFGPAGPGFNQPGQGPIGLFPRDPLRPPPPHQGHQGVVNLNQSGPQNQPRPFMGPRQPFGQQRNPFPQTQGQFGMQGVMHGSLGSLGSQPPHHDPMLSHQPMHQPQHHHRQELPPHHHPQQQQQQQQPNVSQPRPVLLHGPNPFHHQQMQGSPRPMTLRPQNHQQRNIPNRQRMNTPMAKQMQPRNSNLRELPVAPGNTDMNSGALSSNVQPVAKATPGLRPGQSTQPLPTGGRGRGHVAAKPEIHPGTEGGDAFRKEAQGTQPSTTQQKADDDEDEETRQYRLKIEEQKRRREELLRAKEMRRQMQAGVRKKELLNRLNATDKNPAQAGPTQQSQPTAHPIQPQMPQQQQQQPQLLQQRHVLQQAPLSQRPLQPSNPVPNHPAQGATPSPNGSAQTAVQRPNVKARLQIAKGGAQPQQAPRLGAEQQWRQAHQNQQLNQQQLLLRGNSTVQNRIRPAAPPQLSQNNVPLAPPMGQNQHLKRTVMQRSKNPGAESQPVLAKVRVVKLSGVGLQEPMNTDSQSQQQDTWAAAVPQSPANLRKVSMTGQQQQQQQGAGRAPQASPGVMGNQQQSRVVVSSRGRGKWGGPIGRGRPPVVKTCPRVSEGERRTVSIEGLSSSTTAVQLRNLLCSMGPIEMFRLMPQQRKAVAKFTSPEHAANFQMSFHRHMIDLSHINVALIDDVTTCTP